jgi:serine/threonine-protein kinase
MPFIDGRNVWERLQAEGPLPAPEVIRIGRAVADALAFAHGEGVVHRDMKPDNIMLEGDRVLVADFGVARAVSEVQEKLTATGLVVGTPTYMSPEQASGDRQIDGRSDIFGLACVLYELLAGEPPFAGPTPQAALMRRFTGPPRGLRPVVDVPEATEAALLRALARDPADRFATAEEFADALAGAPQARPSPTAPPNATPARRKGCAALLLVAAPLGVLAALVLGASDHQAAPPDPDWAQARGGCEPPPAADHRARRRLPAAGGFAGRGQSHRGFRGCRCDAVIIRACDFDLS